MSSPGQSGLINTFSYIIRPELISVNLNNVLFWGIKVFSNPLFYRLSLYILIISQYFFRIDIIIYKILNYKYLLLCLTMQIIPINELKNKIPYKDILLLSPVLGELI